MLASALLSEGGSIEDQRTFISNAGAKVQKKVKSEE